MSQRRFRELSTTSWRLTKSATLSKFPKPFEKSLLYNTHRKGKQVTCSKIFSFSLFNKVANIESCDNRNQMFTGGEQCLAKGLSKVYLKTNQKIYVFAVPRLHYCSEPRHPNCWSSDLRDSETLSCFQRFPVPRYRKGDFLSRFLWCRNLSMRDE